jgi:SAM-dependent methyltransferase
MERREAGLYFDGLCNICGHKGRFHGEARNHRETFGCPACRATHRYREQAAAILTYFSRGQDVFLARFVRSETCRRLRILEPAFHGPFVRLFKDHPHYTRSYLFNGVPLGETRDGIICQDLCKLTFPDACFDLVITSDVMEHIADVEQAFAEIARVLAVGGAHIFTIPLAWPVPESSVARARNEDGKVVHLLEPRYHRSGDGDQSLVFTDFGRDLIDLHARKGMRARFFRSHGALAPLYRSSCVVAIRTG